MAPDSRTSTRLPGPSRARVSTRRVSIDTPGQVRLERFTLPPWPAPRQVRLSTIAAGICGSDLHVFAGHHPFVDYPVLPGHEIVARVEELGAEVDESWRGALVALEPSLTCGSCDACRRGRYNICEELRVMGFQAAGGMADAFDAPADRLHRLSDALPEEAWTLVEPVAVAVHALRQLGKVEGARVAVVGAGTIGLLCAQVAKAAGAAVSLADPDPERRNVAASLGFEALELIQPRSFPLVLECVGNEAALRSAITAAEKGGRVVIVGVHGSDASVQAGLIQDFELGLQGVLMYTTEDYRNAIELLSTGAISWSTMISARFPFDQAEEAFRRAARGGSTLKVLLTPRQQG